MYKRILHWFYWTYIGIFATSIDYRWFERGEYYCWRYRLKNKDYYRPILRK